MSRNFASCSLQNLEPMSKHDICLHVHKVKIMTSIGIVCTEKGKLAYQKYIKHKTLSIHLNVLLMHIYTYIYVIYKYIHI